ncbi:hypothetical protein M1D97_06130 [Kushneria sp. AK178]
MTSLLWIACLAAALGGYGLWRGFSRDICLSVMLIALGVAAASLIIMSNVISLLLAGAVVIASLGICLFEGRRPTPTPRQGRAKRPRSHQPKAALAALWQGSLRARRAPRQGATPRNHPRQPL